MCRFIESIKLLDGEFKRLEFHQARIQKAFEAIYPNEKAFDLKDFLSKTSYPTEGIFKCRIVYDFEIRKIEFTPYVMRKISSLKLLETQIESSEFKLEDRRDYEIAFAQRGDCDDVLLVKNGLLTDSSYCNIALYDGKSWFTPRIPLLYGVNRADILKAGKVTEKDINANELKDFQQITLFNAMIEFGEVVLDIDKYFRILQTL